MRFVIGTLSTWKEHGELLTQFVVLGFTTNTPRSGIPTCVRTTSWLTQKSSFTLIFLTTAQILNTSAGSFYYLHFLWTSFFSLRIYPLSSSTMVWSWRRTSRHLGWYMTKESLEYLDGRSWDINTNCTLLWTLRVINTITTASATLKKRRSFHARK